MLEKISDLQLLKKTVRSRENEKRYTLEVLECLEEVDRRKLYVEVGCSSLFVYCTNILGYSSSEAYIRVSSCRLIQSEPKVKDYIQEGKISLSSATQIQAFFKEEKPSEKVKDKVIKSSLGLSKRETQSLIGELSSKKKLSKNILLGERLLNKLEKVKEIFGDVEDLEAIEALMDQKIREYEFSKKDRKKKGSKSQRYISRSVKRLVFSKAKNKCEKCGSYRNLQIDHIRPIRLGGNSFQENLQVLCFACNQRKEIKRKLMSYRDQKIKPN